MSSSHMANRHHGVCQGSLWRQCAALSAVSSSSSASSSSSSSLSMSMSMSSSSTYKRSNSFAGSSSTAKNSPALASMSPSPTTSGRVHEYCVLAGVQLSTYESQQALQRGDYPVATFTVVGATSAATMGKKSSDKTSFRLVTNQGTQVTCTAPTRGCRDVWLSAFQAGLEGRLNSLNDAGSDSKNSNSNGTKYADATSGLKEDDNDDIDQLLPKLRPKHFTQTPVRFCKSCGKVERLEFPLCGKVAPLPAYGLEERCDLCKHCSVSQGMLDQAKLIQTLYASAASERNALLKARRLIWSKLAKRKPNSSAATIDGAGQENGAEESSNDSHAKSDVFSLHYQQKVHGWIPSDSSSWSFDQVMKLPEFEACQRVSPVLEGLCQQFKSGIMGLLEFLEQLDEALGSRDETDSLTELKKQAFRLAGDMGTAMKLLLEHALPNQAMTSSGGGSGGGSSRLSVASMSVSSAASTATDTDMLQCILEFFLELAAEGELQSLAFFFPQLCAIHLRMLPPSNHAELLRVELMEDFLLTICCKYSVQLAIELIWTHLADLEDAWTVVERAFAAGSVSSTFASSATSSTPSNLSPSIQHACRRRFAILRFLCELESLLFDFETGWGGGSVTVGHMIQPSKHQVTLLKQQMKVIQRQRRANHKVHGLSQSARMDKITNKKRTLPMEVLAEEALRITKNADYLSSHLVFTKRLCDIAEKLRFLPVSERSTVLQSELSRLNASGSMGGDPLNNIQSHLSRVVRVPITEGHVFRSKERTPVLLLVEIINEGAQMELDAEERLKWQQIGRGQQEAEKSNNAGEETVDVVENGDGDEKKSERSAASEEAAAAATTVGAKVPALVVEGKEATENSEAASERAATALPDGHGHSSEQDEPASSQNGRTRENNASDHDEDERKGKGDGATTSDGKQVITKVPSEDEEFHSAAGSIEDDLPPVDFATPHVQRKVILKIDSGSGLEGSITEGEEKESTHALRRFDSPKGGVESTVTVKTPSKEVVEQLVTTVVTKHLQLPELNSSTRPHTDEGKGESQALSTTAPAANGSKTNDDDNISPKLTPRKSKRNPESSRLPSARKMTTLGSSGYNVGDDGARTNPSHETRRKVLDTIMRKGTIHTVAANISKSAQKSLQEMDKRRAIALLLKGDKDDGTMTVMSDDGDTVDSSRLSLGMSPVNSDNFDAMNNTDDQPTEEDEAMEAIRLLLIQYRVAQGHLSANAAAEALAPGPRSFSESLKTSGTGRAWPKLNDPKEMPHIDAGDVDSRLAGCGILPPAVLQALMLWKGGMVSNGELLELVKKDLEYVKHSLALEDSRDKLSEDSAFWVRFAFGERWAEKRSRIAATSPQACKPGWDLSGVIIKSNDDLRQEAFIMQLIELCREAFNDAGLDLWLHPYRILSTGRTTGIIEMVRNAMSFDALKKRPGYGSGGLRGHLRRMTEFAANPFEAFKTAQVNFVRSLAAYSLLSYLFLFKDRHNGNILLDTAGHVIHIDFGFVFGIAPGGSFSLEMSTPFKLTEEMVAVMGGVKSSLFSEFVTLFCCGFLALQAHCDTFLTIVEITCSNSTFNCFDGKSSTEIVQQLRNRFRPDLDTEETIAFALDLIKDSVESYGTSQYDYFQYLSQGIAA